MPMLPIGGGATLRVPIRLLVAAVRRRTAVRTGPRCAATLAKLAAAAGGHCRSAWCCCAVGAPPCYRAKLLVCCLCGGGGAQLCGGAVTPRSVASGAGMLGGGAFRGRVLDRVRLTARDGLLATRVRAQHRRARSTRPHRHAQDPRSDHSILPLRPPHHRYSALRRSHGSHAAIRAAGPTRCRLRVSLRLARQHRAMTAPCRAIRRGRGSGGCAHVEEYQALAAQRSEQRCARLVGAAAFRCALRCALRRSGAANGGRLAVQPQAPQ
eukprot:scaffold30358_cov65-Phaeocystis_antarctica.AAC.4